MEHIVYKATNQINGKSYIGLSAKSLWDRHKGHLRGVKEDSKTKFHRAIRKHGIESFEWEVLCVAPDRREAAIVEKLLISAFNTFENGYNSTTGGDFAHTLSPDAKERHRQSLKSYKKTPEHRRNLSLAHFGKAKEYAAWNKGKKMGPLPEGQKAKISASLLGRETPWQTGKKRGPQTEETKIKKRQAALANWAARKTRDNAAKCAYCDK